MKILNNRTPTIWVLAWMVMAVSTTMANASETDQDLLQCAGVQNDATRLACFDAVANGLQRAAPARSVASPAKSNSSPRPPVAAAAESAKAEPEPGPGPMQLIKLKKNSLGRWLFYLDNGDVWKQSDSARLRVSTTLPASVRLSKGLVGNTRLHIDGYRKPVKVTLIRSDK